MYLYSLAGGDDNSGYSLKVYVNGTPPSNATGGPIDVIDSIRAWSIPDSGMVKFSSHLKSAQFLLIGIDTPPDFKLYSEKHMAGFQPVIYPNPNNGTFSINLAPGANRIEIFSLEGQQVYCKELNTMQNTLELKTGLHPGIYILRIHSLSNTIPIKLLII